MSKCSIAFLLFSFFLNAQEDLIFQDLFSSSQDSNISCYRIPSLATTPSGDLLAIIDERVESCGDLKYNRDINIVMKRSSDNGETWREHTLEATEDAVQEVLQESFDADGKSLIK